MNTDNILSVALTFALLIGGTAAIGSELIGTARHPAAATTQVVMLPAVTVIGHRQSVVTIAAATVAAQPQRLQ